jgi:hypothetical protein
MAALAVVKQALRVEETQAVAEVDRAVMALPVWLVVQAVQAS